MNRAEFLETLRSELADISTDEREEAIKFYNEYFDDAGEDKEQAIIAELGSPARVAVNIRANCGSIPAVLSKKEEKRQSNGTHSYGTNGSRTILLIVLVVLTFPLWIGFVAAAFGLLFGLLATIIALIAAGGAIFIAGVVSFFASIPLMAFNVPTGLIVMGISLILTAVGCLLTGIMVYALGKGFPACGRAIGNLFRSIFSKRRSQ